MTLFDHHRQSLTEKEAPLAARMRPRSLDEFVGQAHIIGVGRLLRRAIEADQLASLLFYGPPGTGKTTLARVIANTTRAQFIALNAVLAGVKDIREAIATAQDRRGLYGQRTILFVDEVHRFNKAQQDALLPWVETGTVVLIGATTENPYFEVNKALVSRSRIFQLKPLTDTDLRQVLQQTLNDGDRGYGKLNLVLEPDASEHLVNVANGDARALLNALELAVETTPADETGQILITLEVAEDSIQQRAVLYDKEGDAHFDIISAFIKSVRGSDPDAALYWLARMVYAGENPRFIFRRLIILASEDIGLADPNAVVVVNACAESFDRVGMPEGRYPLAQATLYLATTAKSNSVMGFFDALANVEQEREADVPNPLRDPSRDKHSFGHGSGYLYPHAYRDHWVAQQYLPTNLQGQVFYQPSDQGYEEQIRVQVAQQREAQLAALIEGDSSLDVLTFSPANSGTDRWLQRTLSQAGEQLAQLRDRLFATYPLQRHHVILDLNASSGLLTWEAVRQVPEGGVYVWVLSEADATALQEQSARLPAIQRPVIIQTAAQDLDDWFRNHEPNLQCDRILGRNVLTTVANHIDPRLFLKTLRESVAQSAVWTLAENLPSYAQRLYGLVDAQQFNPKLYQTLVAAEEAIYHPKKIPEPDRPSLTWDLETLQAIANDAGLAIELHLETTTRQQRITPGLLTRWFQSGSDRPSYRDYLAKSMSDNDIATVQQIFTQTLSHQTVTWQGAIAFLSAPPNPKS